MLSTLQNGVRLGRFFHALRIALPPTAHLFASLHATVCAQRLHTVADR